MATDTNNDGEDQLAEDDADVDLSSVFDPSNSIDSGDTGGSSDATDPVEGVPDDLDTGDDDFGIVVEDPDADRVDVEDIKTPRPVTRTIGARTLAYDGYPDKPRYENLPGKSQCTQCPDDADVEDCEHNTTVTDLQFAGSAARRRRVADAVDYDYDGDELVSLYGVVIQRFEDDSNGFNPHLIARIADGTGVVDVELHPRMDPLAEFEPGDEILVTECQRDDSDDSAAFSVTEESSLLRVAYHPDREPADVLTDQTSLTRTRRKFESMENKTAANNWIADVLVDEWTIETPRGGDEIFVYVDDPDSENYGTFAAEGESRIKEIIDQYIPPESNNPRNKNQIVKTVQDRTYVASDAFRGGAPDAEARRWSVAVQNGVIDLRSGELYEHGPEWRCRDKLPVEYNLEYDELGDAWDQFLDDVCKDVADRETILYMIGHALARHYPIEAVFGIIGPGGNGKTVFNKAISPLLGDAKGTTSIGMMTDKDYQFGAGSVKDLHFALDDDATDVKAQDLSILKKLSGGAEAQMHEKEEKVSDAGYDNYATLAFLSNNPPVFGDKSDGAKRRMYPVIMPHRFTSDPTDGHKDATSEDELLVDLTSDEELQRLLAVAVQYAQDIHHNCTDVLPVGRSEDERWELYEQYSDSVMQFWNELMTQETGARVPRSVVYEIYVQWAEENGIDPLTAGGRNGFWQLSDQCPAVSYKRDGVYSDGERAVEHVMLTVDSLDHAPQWVRDEWEADVSEDTQTLANRLDRVTPIADLDKGYCTTQGTVIGRKNIQTDNGTAVMVTIEDTTHAIDVYEWLGEFDDVEDAKLDGVYVGDKLTLERATLTSGNGGDPQLQVKNVTDVTVSEDGPLKSEDNRHVEDDQNEGGLSQEERVREVRNTIGAEQNRTDVSGVVVETVLDACEDRGIDREKAAQTIDKLRQQGDVFEPQDGRVRVTGGD